MPNPNRRSRDDEAQASTPGNQIEQLQYELAKEREIRKELQLELLDCYRRIHAQDRPSY